MPPKNLLSSIDPLLKPYTNHLIKRQQRALLRELEFTDGIHSISDIANEHLYYGLHQTDKGWIFREKAPNAQQIYLYGDFSHWQIKPEFALHPIGNGDWEIELPAFALQHTMLYKLWVVWSSGADERLPAYATRVVQDEDSKVFCAQVWTPTPYRWQYAQPAKPQHPLIYEAHVGMASQEEKIASYWEFKEHIIPRIKTLGYNTIQLMAIQEHPYYGSFGYQVSNFFAPSSRFGTPEELKELIDTAHREGITVILDIVHSHAVSNEKEGLAKFDGSDHLYFHSGKKGEHPVWNSRCFNYSKPETILFLLSNLKYWLQEFHFDGFRFDGVTSMCYWNHGIGVHFVNYQQYFDQNVDEDAITYLTLANSLIHTVNPHALTIAEDVSGMPGMAFPTAIGGIGFNFRMSMGIADFWINTLKNLPDEHWNMGDLYFQLTNKREEEKTISYVECHDQAMVGDKTLLFRMIDSKMYDKMAVQTPDLIVERGIALHKMIRLVTLSLSSGGYLNFMGNEFGHPEWIDFPRLENHWSYAFARRQWALADNTSLKYAGLQQFDQTIIQLFHNTTILDAPPQKVCDNNNDLVLAFTRSNYLFVFNFHPSTSFSHYEISCPQGLYSLLFSTDDPLYNGFGNIDSQTQYPTFCRNQQHRIKLYLPCRTALVLKQDAQT